MRLFCRQNSSKRKQASYPWDIHEVSRVAFISALSPSCVSRLSKRNYNPAKPQVTKQCIRSKIKYFLVAPDQTQTLHSTGEVLPLLRQRGMCRCLWHRVRFFFRVLTAHPHPKTHTVPPPPPGWEGMQTRRCC